MTLQYFHALNKEKQQDVILRNGTFLMERTDGPFKIMLYQLEDFYVEVYILIPHNKVALFRCFDTLELLDPYLKDINLSGLMQEVFS